MESEVLPFWNAMTEHRFTRERHSNADSFRTDSRNACRRCTRSRMSLMPCRRMQRRSTPSPNAKPRNFFRDRIRPRLNTFGSTMPGATELDPGAVPEKVNFDAGLGERKEGRPKANLDVAAQDSSSQRRAGPFSSWPSSRVCRRAALPFDGTSESALRRDRPGR